MNTHNDTKNTASDERATPRWALATIACAVQCGGRWHDVTVQDISLGGVKVRGRWDHALPITAVSLEDCRASLTGDLLIVPAETVRVEAPRMAGMRTTAALRFDVQDKALATRLLRFLSTHIAAHAAHA